MQTLKDVPIRVGMKLRHKNWDKDCYVRIDKIQDEVIYITYETGFKTSHLLSALKPFEDWIVTSIILNMPEEE